MNVTLKQTNLEDLAIQVLINRCLTYSDQHFLNHALLYKDSLKENERILIERVFYGIRHGLVQVLDTTSV